MAFENIVKGLKDEHHAVRIRAAMSLGNLGDKRAVEYLTHALEDENEMVRSKVAEAIIKIKVKKLHQL
ncbi:MAG: HEAT repeat domain-containing protein [Methanobacterium sp.]